MIDDTPEIEELNEPNRLTQFLHEQAILAKKREDEETNLKPTEE